MRMLVSGRPPTFLQKVFMCLVLMTLIYIALYLWLLHHWNDVRGQRQSSNTAHSSSIDDAFDSIMSQIREDQRRTISRHPVHQILSMPYGNAHRTASKAKPFNTSIINKDDYSMAINNHFHSLYTNQSNENHIFYAHKPQCIQQHSQIKMCFIADCFDPNAEMRFTQQIPTLLSDPRHTNYWRKAFDLDPQMQTMQRHLNSFDPRQLPNHAQSRKHRINAALNSMQTQSQNTNTNTSELPDRWLKFRAHILTQTPYTHLIYRPNRIRKVVGSRSGTCFVSHEYRFVFVHVLKSGGTSMSGFLGYALCNTTNLKQCDSFHFKKTACKKLKGRYPEYFYFTVVRNPYNRMFSLWSHQMVKGLEKMHSKFSRRRHNKGPQSHMDSSPQLRYIVEHNDGNRSVTVNAMKESIDDYSRTELLESFAAFVVERRFHDIRARRMELLRRAPVSGDHNYEQHWWLFDNHANCPIVDFIGHLESIEYDIQFILNLITDNKPIVDYYVQNGEYWKVNTYGSNLKNIFYDNAGRMETDGFNITSLTDIFETAARLTGIDVKQLTYELYEVDFDLFGYDVDRIENNLLIKHMR